MEVQIQSVSKRSGGGDRIYDIGKVLSELKKLSRMLEAEIDKTRVKVRLAEEAADACGIQPVYEPLPKTYVRGRMRGFNQTGTEDWVDLPERVPLVDPTGVVAFVQELRGDEFGSAEWEAVYMDYMSQAEAKLPEYVKEWVRDDEDGTAGHEETHRNPTTSPLRAIRNKIGNLQDELKQFKSYYWQMYYQIKRYCSEKHLDKMMGKHQTTSFPLITHAALPSGNGHPFPPEWLPEHTKAMPLIEASWQDKVLVEQNKYSTKAMIPVLLPNPTPTSTLSSFEKTAAKYKVADGFLNRTVVSTSLSTSAALPALEARRRASPDVPAAAAATLTPVAFVRQPLQTLQTLSSTSSTVFARHTDHGDWKLASPDTSIATSTQFRTVVVPFSSAEDGDGEYVLYPGGTWTTLGLPRSSLPGFEDAAAHHEGTGRKGLEGWAIALVVVLVVLVLGGVGGAVVWARRRAKRRREGERLGGLSRTGRAMHGEGSEVSVKGVVFEMTPGGSAWSRESVGAPAQQQERPGEAV